MLKLMFLLPAAGTMGWVASHSHFFPCVDVLEKIWKFLFYGNLELCFL